MMIADSQVHLWSFRGDGNPWHRMVPAFTVEELIAEMDEAGVDRAVVVPPMWMGNDNSQATAAAAAHPGRLAVLGRMDLFDQAAPTSCPTGNSSPACSACASPSASPRNRKH